MRKLTYAILLLVQATVSCAQETVITPDQIGIIREWRIRSVAEFEPARALSSWPSDCSNAGHRYRWATIAEVVGANQLIVHIACDDADCVANDCHQTMLVKIICKHDGALQGDLDIELLCSHDWIADDGHEGGLRWCLAQAKNQCTKVRIFRELAPDGSDDARTLFFIPSASDDAISDAFTRINKCYDNLCSIARG